MRAAKGGGFSLRSSVGVASLAVLTFSALTSTRALRVGDGSEYYALFFAWRAGGRPWMTAAGWSAYDAACRAGRIEGLLDVPTLQQTFSGLTLGGTQDFHHFWAYSGLAAVVDAAAEIVGIHLGAHRAFMLLHVALLVMLAMIAWRLYRHLGLLSVGILTLLSPAVWFVDKVHTEHFTFCLTTSAVMLFGRGRYAWSALLLALASTQNPSFAAPALVSGVFGAIRAGMRFRGPAVAAAVIGATIALVHPAYYLVRYGALSAQLYTGGAKLFAGWPLAWVWTLEPDIGLLPNWWLGSLVLAGAIAAAIRSRLRGALRGRRFDGLVFALVYVVVSLLAQSSTLNLNAGGTPGPARYVVWYLALFFPILHDLLERVRRSLPHAAASGAVLCAASAYSFAFFRPSLDESGNGRPSPISYVIQRFLPRAYDPPVEIFAERYGGVGESFSVLAKTFVVVGPSCEKALVIQDLRDGTVLSPPDCAFDGKRVSEVIRRHLTRELGSALPRYVHLTAEEMRDVRAHYPATSMNH